MSDPGRSRASRAMDEYADGRDAAFADVYDELAPRLLRYARRLMRSEATAEDVVQQAFLQLHQARGRFARGSAVEPWAYAITRRLVIDWARERKTQRKHGVVALFAREDGSLESEAVAALEADPEAQAADAQLGQALGEALAGVPEGLRAAFTLLRVEGLTAEEVGDVLGISPGAAKVRAHRAGVELRTKLGALLGRGPRSGGEP